jgi:hypothetical protein
VQINQRIGGLPGCDLKDVTMRMKLSAVGPALLLAAGVVVAFGSASARAEQLKYDKRGRVYYGPSGPNVIVQQGPHTRLYISKRSWLDAGTEVQPGERKFTDYAYPPGVSFARQNNNRPIDRQPLNPPHDFGTEVPPMTRFPLY